MIAINVKVATDRKRFNELYPLIFELFGLIENAPISSDGEVLVVDDHLRHLTDQIEPGASRFEDQVAECRPAQCLRSSR